MNKEINVFNELENFCTQPGYIHALSNLIFEEYSLEVKDELVNEDLLKTYNNDKLIRSEISTLIGLLVKNNIDFTIPTSNEFNKYYEGTYYLLSEIHKAMCEKFPKITKSEKNEVVLKDGLFLREAIFYSGESAFLNQYLEFSIDKYKNDNDWLKLNKGFTIEEAVDLANSINSLRLPKFKESFSNYDKTCNEFSLLNAFSFSIEELYKKTGINYEIIKCFLDSFSLDENSKNINFKEITDFNEYNAYPIIKKDDIYIIFQSYSLNEAIYNTPFYWIIDDKKYMNIGMKNRGDFLENFVFKKMVEIFGINRVFKNVNIIGSQKEIKGEIDILVLYANRAIIFQAKSKKLTLLSRKGNDNSIKNDFKKSIQDAYNQGFDCSCLIKNKKNKLICNDKEVVLKTNLREIYIIPIISENYPALSFQVREFITIKHDNKINPPYVIDLFTLEVISEFLDSPLLFLNFLNKRVKLFEKLQSSQEIIILSFFLKNNLYNENNEHKIMYFADNNSVDLDRAYLIRKNNYPGDPEIEGYYSTLQKSTIGKLLKKIELKEDNSSVDLGFQLMQFNEKAILDLSEKLDMLINSAKNDKCNHDLTFDIPYFNSGVTIHCNDMEYNIAYKSLFSHIENRKYLHKAKRWFGLCLGIEKQNFRFGIDLNYSWIENDRIRNTVLSFKKSLSKNKKIGRNDPCPCGSGKKYKNCCL